jgi:hypothetical protein
MHTDAPSADLKSGLKSAVASGHGKTTFPKMVNKSFFAGFGGNQKMDT